MRNKVLACLVAASMLGVGCGGGSDGNPLSVEAQLQRCLGNGSTYMLALMTGAGYVTEAIQNGDSNPFPGLVITPAGGANSWNFTYALDADQDMNPQSAFTGTITFSADPTDGIDPGDTAQVVWSVGGSEGLDGDGIFNVEFTDGEVAPVWGAGNVDLPGDCAFEFTIPESDPLSVGTPRALDASFFGAALFGSVDIAAYVRSHSLFANIMFPEFDNTVSATGVEIDGVEVDDFEAEMPFNEETLQVLAACLLLHAEGGFSIMDEILDAIEDEVINNQEYLDGTFTELAGSTATRVDFQIDFTDNQGFFEMERVTGTVRFSEDPANAQGSLIVTLECDVTLRDGAGRIFTTNNKPLVMVFPEFGQNGILGFQTENSVINGEFQCDLVAIGAFPVQEQEPPRCRAWATFTNFRDGGGESDSGTASLRARFQGNSMRFDFAGESNAELEGLFYLNGVPLPAEFLFIALDLVGF